jgi:hypothetical protein
MSKVLYAGRDEVKSVLNVKTTARDNKKVDRAIDTASDLIEGMLHRKFYPETTSHYFSGSDFQVTSAGELYLYGYDLISVTSMLLNSVAVTYTDYFVLDVEDANDFPVSLTTINETDEILITGVFGYPTEDILETTLVGAINSSVTSLDILDSSVIDVGNTIKIDDEYLKVTEKLQKTSSQTTQGALASQASVVTVPVTSGTGFSVGEVILIDAEKMLIVDIAGNNLIVERNYDGSVLASHTISTTIYVPRTLQVVRAQLGTTAASHSDLDNVFKLTPPSLINSLCVAEAINIMEQQKSGYARTIGQGEGTREVSGRGLSDIRKAAQTNYRRFRGGAA